MTTTPDPLTEAISWLEEFEQLDAEAETSDDYEARDEFEESARHLLPALVAEIQRLRDTPIGPSLHATCDDCGDRLHLENESGILIHVSHTAALRCDPISLAITFHTESSTS